MRRSSQRLGRCLANGESSSRQEVQSSQYVLDQVSKVRVETASSREDAVSHLREEGRV